MFELERIKRKEIVRLKYLKYKCSNAKMFPLKHITLKTDQEIIQKELYDDINSEDASVKIDDEDIRDQSISLLDDDKAKIPFDGHDIKREQEKFQQDLSLAS